MFSKKKNFQSSGQRGDFDLNNHSIYNNNLKFLSTGTNGITSNLPNPDPEIQEEAMTKLEQENQTLLERVEKLEQANQELSEKVERFEHFREIFEELKDKFSSEKSETTLTWLKNKFSSFVKEEPEGKKKSIRVENLDPDISYFIKTVEDHGLKLTDLESRVNFLEGSKDGKSTDWMDQRKHQSHSSHYPNNSHQSHFLMDSYSQNSHQNSHQNYPQIYPQIYPQNHSSYSDQNQLPLPSRTKIENQIVKKPEPKIYYSSQGESMVHSFMKQNFSNCEHIEVIFDDKAIDFQQQPYFLFIFVVITDRFDDPASWGKWIAKRIQETG